MTAINSGDFKLRKSTAAATPPPTDARGSLMDAIQSGNFKLRKSIAPEAAPLAAARANPAEIGGLAGQIAAAMAARRQGSQLSDRDSMDDSDDDDW